jgi:hypothetical protein
LSLLQLQLQLQLQLVTVIIIIIITVTVTVTVTIAVVIPPPVGTRKESKKKNHVRAPMPELAWWSVQEQGVVANRCNLVTLLYGTVQSQSSMRPIVQYSTVQSGATYWQPP